MAYLTPFFTKNYPRSVCGLRPPVQKKKNISTLTPQGKTGCCVASLSRHTESRWLSVMRLGLHRAARLGALRSVCEVRQGWLSQTGAFCGDTPSLCRPMLTPSQSVAIRGVLGVFLWRCSHTQSCTQSNAQFNVHLAQFNATNTLSRAYFCPSLSLFPRSTPSRTPKNATPRPYRDKISQHLSKISATNKHTPSLTAGGEQGGIYG